MKLILKGKGMWQILAATDEKPALIDTYITQIQTIKMKSTEKIIDFVNLIKNVENKLAAVGQIFEADETRRILLRGVWEE